MFLPSFLLFFAGSASALTLPLQRRSPSNGPRSTTVVVSNPNGISNTGFTNIGNGLYTATIYLQGQPFQVRTSDQVRLTGEPSLTTPLLLPQVQIDSGSSDLWINTEGVEVNGLVDVGMNSTTSYGLVTICHWH